QSEVAQEDVVFLLAEGTGTHESFRLRYAEDARDLASGATDRVLVHPAAEGKWTDLLLSEVQRQLLRDVEAEFFVPLSSYGAPTLGTVTGANDFFALDEYTRERVGLREDQLVRISPPGTKHLSGLSLSPSQWERLRYEGLAVWLFRPEDSDESEAVQAYVARGEAAGIPNAYKCQIRTPWWRPPSVA
ncbi:unnamed protein product, partial [Phaeothamnion confervicola]